MDWFSIVQNVSWWGHNTDVCEVVHGDRLYGSTYHTPFSKRLSQTQEVQRLKRVSHLGLEPSMVLHNICASKCEHTQGVQCLNDVVCLRIPELQRYRDLVTAISQGHDIGSPPFTHTSEPAQRRVLGADHETVLRTRFANSEFAQVVTSEGLSFEEVVEGINGIHPDPILQQFLTWPCNGDTLDGIGRYQLMWRSLQNGHAYSPQLILSHLRLENGELVFRDGLDDISLLAIHLHKFVDCRRQVFDEIHSPTIECPQALVERALDLAVDRDELPPEFFTWTDERASDHLEFVCNPQTQELVGFARRNLPYRLVYNEMWQQPVSQDLKQHLATANRHVYAKYLASELRIPAHHVCLMLGKYKGIKEDMCDVKCFMEESHEPEPFLSFPPYYFARAYLHPNSIKHEQEVANCMNRLLGT